jgi:hypothetical protein
MDDSSRLGPDDVVALVDATEQHVAEANGPDAVVDLLLEANRVLRQRTREEEQPLFNRMVPAFVTRLTRKYPGYSTAAARRCRTAATDGTARPAADRPVPRAAAPRCTDARSVVKTP